MTRKPHITHILAGLNRVLDYEQLLQSDRTAIRMAIAEIEAVFPEQTTVAPWGVVPEFMITEDDKP